MSLRNSLSDLRPLAPRFHAERAELLELLLERGILRRTETQPVCSRDGRSARWMLNSLGVTLSARGAELAGRCLLEMLQRFDGRQIATYGLIGAPILQSCILQSGGRYRGLLVRKEAKPYGAKRVIEGDLDPDEPVILVDDSIASGTAFRDGCQRLEQAGVRVEGGVFLVRFGWSGGWSHAQQHGYHVEALYDIFEDFMTRMEGEARPERNPTKRFPEISWSGQRAPEGLHPAELARLAMREYLSTGQLPRAPERMDRDYDSAGGAWVSVRSRENVYIRHARHGFWHFPWERPWTPAEDVVRAALKTASLLPAGAKGQALLANSHIAVTCFSALEECAVGQLDNDRYGIVVASRERPSIMGGALPRMPGIPNAWRQLQHARVNNAKLTPLEPYVIYRHDVAKFVEPGASWQPSGVPATAPAFTFCEDATARRVIERARDLAVVQLLGSGETTAPLAGDALPPNLHSLYVTVYVWGRLRGCMGAAVTKLDADLKGLVAAALGDERFTHGEVNDPEAIAVSVSLLWNPLDIGQMAPEEAIRRSVHGRQALMVSQGRRSGLVLPFVAALYDLSELDYAREVIDKAGITRPPYRWRRFDCATWRADAWNTGPLEGMFLAQPAGDSSEDFEALLARHARSLGNYLARHQRSDGSLFASYEPFRNRLHAGENMPRLAHGAWVLARAGARLAAPHLQEAGGKAIGYFMGRLKGSGTDIWIDSAAPSISETAFLLLALCELERRDPLRGWAGDLARMLWSRIDRHGSIATHPAGAATEDGYQDYFPGQALLALAASARAGVAEVDERRLASAFKFYRHRFLHKRAFGQVSWLMQAASAWWRVRGGAEFADLVFQVGDWILQYQNASGAFLNDHQPDTPGYTSAVYLEGIGAALGMAQKLDSARYARYAGAFERGLRFVDRLMIDARDASVLPNTELALGGIRKSLYSSAVRADFVQHALSAALERYESVGRTAEAVSEARPPFLEFTTAR